MGGCAGGRTYREPDMSVCRALTCIIEHWLCGLDSEGIGVMMEIGLDPAFCWPGRFPFALDGLSRDGSVRIGRWCRLIFFPSRRCLVRSDSALLGLRSTEYFLALSDHVRSGWRATHDGKLLSSHGVQAR
jgi:hypothetical protein